jgi:hypothetical protein
MDAAQGVKPTITSNIDVAGQSRLRFATDIVFSGLLRDAAPLDNGSLAFEGVVTLAGPPAQYTKPVRVINGNYVTVASEGVLGSGPVTVEAVAGLTISNGPKTIPGGLTLEELAGVELGGNRLTVGGLAGRGTVRNSSATAVTELHLAGTLFGDSLDKLTITGKTHAVLDSGSEMSAELNRSSPTLSDLLVIGPNSTLDIGEDVQLSLRWFDPMSPLSGTTFKLVDNQSSQAIVGTFEGLPEGAILVTLAGEFQITYFGGTGNDIVVSLVPDPAEFSVLAVMLSALFGRSLKRGHDAAVIDLKRAPRRISQMEK